MAPAALVRIGVAGALGHMGGVTASVVKARKDATLVALVDRPDFAGQDCGGMTLSTLAEALAACDVIVDFSTPAGSVALAQAAAKHGGPALIIASTGASEDESRAIEAAAKSLAMVRSGNFALGVNLLAGLVARAARTLGPEDWDIEIVEAHHRRKVDAPSGTALMLGRAAAQGRGVDLPSVEQRARDGLTGPRAEGGIGFASLRGGGVVGEHSVIFAAEDEIITLSHSARDRGLFARGAVAAALWVAGKPPGLYDMMDVLGFNTDA
jgi:4-hydroxy-tetrahydrodipicolinate reductase